MIMITDYNHYYLFIIYVMLTCTLINILYTRCVFQRTLNLDLDRDYILYACANSIYEYLSNLIIYFF